MKKQLVPLCCAPLVAITLHANLPALQAVLADVARTAPGAPIWHCGDVVGYGAEPGACIALLGALDLAGTVRGNHDKVAAGLEPARLFHEHARVAIEWTRDVLTDAERRWLAALPAGPASVTAEVMICHGAPYDEDAYLFDEGDAWRAFGDGVGGVCLYGHTHVPAAFRERAEAPGSISGTRPGHGTVVRLDEGRLLLNPGSVGQPRDLDPRASFAILDLTERKRHEVNENSNRTHDAEEEEAQRNQIVGCLVCKLNCHTNFLCNSLAWT